jgi:acetyl esterase/lipase
MTTLKDRIFASPDGVDLRMDIFYPGTPGPHPVVLCIHGGGWISGSKEEYAPVAEEFARRGFAGAACEYRLAPLYPFPAAVQDVRAAVRFLRQEADALGTRPDAVFAFGNSAGGHLSSFLALSPEPTERVNAAVNVSGLTDLTNPDEQHAPIAHDFLQQFVGAPYVGNEERWIEASPYHNIIADAAPVLNIHGALDEIVNPSQSVRFHEALKAAGARSELLLLEGEGHSFTPEAFEQILERSAAFFREVRP